MEKENKGIADCFAAFKKDPELNKDKLLHKLQNYRDKWSMDRAANYDRVWKTNIAFYRGDHYVRENINNASSPYRVRVRENHTNNIVQRICSIIEQNMPISRVFPNTIEWEDVQNAESSEQYLKYINRHKKLNLQFSKLIRYSCITGNGFITSNWNTSLGGRMDLGPSETKTGEPKEAMYHGDHEIQVDDPFRILCRPGIDEWDDMPDYIRLVPTSRALLEKQYGSIESEGAKFYNPQNGKERSDEDTIIASHYFHKPTEYFEEGMYVCWVGSKVLKASDFPYDCGKFPTKHLAFDKPPMRLYGTSSIEQIMDLQEQLNRAASMIIEARNLVARPRVFASHEAQVPSTSISDRPGEIIKYKQAGGAPQFAVPQFGFAEMNAHKSDVRSAMGQVSGITTASRGEIPQAARTALALQLVLEQDRSQYLPFIKLFHQTVLDVNFDLLSHAAQFISEKDPRSIKIEKMTGSSALFHGGMVPGPLDMYLEDTNPMGWTAGGRIENVGQLAQLGVLTDKRQILEMIGLQTSDPAFETIKINMQAAQRENIDLLKGKMLDITPEDDDNTHLEQHVKIPQSYEFRSKPPIVQQAILAHIQQHKDRLFGAQAGSVPGAAGSPPPAPNPGMPNPNGKAATRQIESPEMLASTIQGANPQGLMTEMLQRRA